MKKTFATFIAAVAALSLFAGCAKKSTTDSNVIKIGATPEPHAEMLYFVKADLEAQGYKVEVVEFTDYVTPNEALENGELDANFFQHIPYLESFNTERNFHLVNAGGIHVEPVALYSKKYSSLNDLPKGATIAIPNDPTNEGRALLLLQSAGLITLDEKAGIEATPFDVTVNALGLKFSEIEAASLPRVLQDVDAAIINGNYAIPAGLIATRDGLYIEGSDSPYVNVIATKKGNEKLPKIEALIKALQSDKIKNWVSEKYPNGEVVVAF